MKIKEIMEKPVLIPEDATKKELVTIAKKHPNMPIFIVVDKDKKFLGDIHENDLFIMAIPNELFSAIGMELAFDIEKKFFAENAKQIMRKHDLVCYSDEEFMAVATRLAGVEVNEMPVLDRKEKVVGVITEGLLLRYMKVK